MVVLLVNLIVWRSAVQRNGLTTDHVCLLDTFIDEFALFKELSHIITVFL